MRKPPDRRRDRVVDHFFDFVGSRSDGIILVGGVVLVSALQLYNVALVTPTNVATDPGHRPERSASITIAPFPQCTLY
jgi:hypothetical protein